MATETPQVRPRQPAQRSITPLDLIKFVIGKIFELLIRALESKNVAIAVGGLVVMFLGWVYMLPQSERVHASPAEFAEGISHVLGHGLLAVGGWLLSVLVMVVSGAVLWLQHKRIRSQGVTLIKLRQSQDPDRLSAGNREALLAYAVNSAKELNLVDPPADKKGEPDG